ncbi:MAG TPA: S41 family peptidase [Steroidobacter sp.]|jgi:carboxyl-terminal processing protease|nr:S41 family peptidase [Steroidobacter sp.]
MPRIPTCLRFVSILVVGLVSGFALSVGRTVQAEREIDAPEPVESAAPPPLGDHAPWRDARLFAEVLERIRKEYVEDVSDHELIEAAIRGMVADLDPHSAYLGPAEFDEIRISSTGEYSGVGVEVALQSGAVKVVTAMEGAPAQRAGVHAGDAIVAIDGIPVDLDDLNDTIDRMRGKSGTEVKIAIAREGEPAPLEFMLERESVQVNSVRRDLLAPGIGYVRITHFSETTARDLQRALSKLRKQNAGALEGLILDLRSNPGGVLEAAVAVSDLFLEQGVIVSADGRTADAKFEMDAQPGDELRGAPMAVLVNKGSASASEIVAGALKDHARARLLGQQTYGKGSVQTVMPLSDGHAIKLTTSRYFTPSGASIHGRGITPHIVIDAAQAPTQRGQLNANENLGDLKQDYEVRAALDLLREDRPPEPHKSARLIGQSGEP